MIFVDGVDLGDPDDVALRDRRTLSADGVLIVVATISADDGELGRRPRDHLPRRAVHRGRRGRSLDEELRDVVEDSLDEAAEDGVSETGPDPGGPPRRRRRVRLRAPEAPPDGAAGRGRGLALQPKIARWRRPARSRAPRRGGRAATRPPCIAERSISAKSVERQLPHARRRSARGRASDWRRLKSGSASGVIVYSTASVGDRLADRVVAPRSRSRPATARRGPGRRRGRPPAAARLDHLPRAVRLRGRSSSSSPMFARVTMSSAMTSA